MLSKAMRLGLFVILMFVLPGAIRPTRAQEKTDPYPAMAPVNQYLIAERASEISLARSAAPASISNDADVMVLDGNGYTTAVKGSNGFICIVERSWANATDSPEFWNPKVRAPNCFNSPAGRTFLPIYLMKTKMALTGKSKTDILSATESALDKKELPALQPGAMCYMMSKAQYLSDRDKSWYPHLMWFLPKDTPKTWGANLADSPIMGADDPEERSTIYMVTVANWSDGSPGPR